MLHISLVVMLCCLVLVLPVSADDPPTVISTSLQNGAVNVPVSTTNEITIVFSEPINPEYLDVYFETIGASGYVNYPHEVIVVGDTVTISAPDGMPWLEYWVYNDNPVPDTGYYWVTVSNVYDTNGNRGDGVQFHFTMEPLDKTPPSVVSTYPENGAITVPLDVTIAATLDSEINRCVGTVELRDHNGILVESLTWDAPDYLHLAAEPTVSLINGETYTVTLHGIIDSYGNVMPDYSWSFTTTPDVQNLITTVDNMGLTAPVEAGLMEKLADVQTLIAQGKYKPARQTLLAFINQVKAQTGKGHLTTDMASSLIESAQEIINLLPPK